MSRKVRFAADRIAKSFIPDASSSSSSEHSSSGEPDSDAEPEFNPSHLRADSAPVVESSEASEASMSDGDSEEDESDSDSAPIPEPEAVRDLEAELAQLEQDDGGGLIKSLRQQQEADLRVARGTSALQSQYASLLLLRLKFQGLLIGANVLPPAPAPFEAAAADPDVAALLGEIHDLFGGLEAELHDMKLALEKTFGWDDPPAQMLDIVRHWGSRLRLAAGPKRGTVINRPVDEQITADIAAKTHLIQPSRHRDDADSIFGLSQQPQVSAEYYNDYAWYKRLLAEVVGDKRPEVRVLVGKPKKKLLRSKQIHYEVIPKLQGFVVPTRPFTVPDDVDALYNSLMK
jgi:hypothetical protein